MFTDGSSSPKTKEGGWAFCTTMDVKAKETLHTDFGWKPATTNNRMELTAVINALHYAYFNYEHIRKILVYSDSEYVSNPLYFGLLNEWRSKNYKKETHTYKNGSKVGTEITEVKNADLWEELYQVLKKYKFRKIEVDVLWVKGHNGSHYNEVCDKLAKLGRERKATNHKYEEKAIKANRV